MTTAAIATAVHKIDIDPARTRDSFTRGLLRRIMRRVRHVMARWYRTVPEKLCLLCGRAGLWRHPIGVP
jgi:hypothetical protein